MALVINNTMVSDGGGGGYARPVKSTTTKTVIKDLGTVAEPAPVKNQTTTQSVKNVEMTDGGSNSTKTTTTSTKASSILESNATNDAVKRAQEGQSTAIKNATSSTKSSTSTILESNTASDAVKRAEEGQSTAIKNATSSTSSSESVVTIKANNNEKLYRAKLEEVEALEKSIDKYEDLLTATIKRINRVDEELAKLKNLLKDYDTIYELIRSAHNDYENGGYFDGGKSFHSDDFSYMLTKVGNNKQDIQDAISYLNKERTTAMNNKENYKRNINRLFAEKDSLQKTMLQLKT